MTLRSRIRRASAGRFLLRHPSDAELLELALPGSRGALEHDTDHVTRCDECTERFRALNGFVEAVALAGRTEADDAASSERMTAQRRRIMRRIRRSIEPRTPARILRFPTMPRPAFATMQRATRWLGAAAAAGLLVGVTIGQYIHLHPPAAPTGEASAVPSVALEPVDGPLASTTMASPPSGAYSVLDEVDLVLATPRIPELSPLDEFTPRIREVSINPW